MKKKKNIFLLLLIISGSFMCLYVITTFARYTSNSVWDYYLKSQGFYFGSDFLEANGKKNINTLWNGESVHFSIHNNLNQTIITDYDINYNVNCSVISSEIDDLECHLNGTNTSNIEGVLSSFEVCKNTTNNEIDVSNLSKTECELSGYTWEKEIAVKDLYFDIVSPSNQEIKNAIIEVKASSTAPYKKTLTGTFTLYLSNKENGEIIKSFTSADDYNRLTITNTYTSNKCVLVKWDSSKQLIDIDTNTFLDYKTDLNGYLNEIKINVFEKDNISYKFYQKNSNNITIDDFTVEEIEC